MKYDCYRTPLLFIFYKTLEGESLGWEREYETVETNRFDDE